MSKISRYKRFINENKDIIEFPIKKFLSIIKDKIENGISEGENIFSFDFKNEITLPISFKLIINWTKNTNYKYSGSINKDDVINNRFKGFKLNIVINDDPIDYNQLYSVINHELKHVYDLHYNNTKSFNNIEGYNFLKREYIKNTWILDFLELSNLSLEHELDARTSMIYDKLRWLKTFDKSQLLDEFKKTYVYKSLLMIKSFNHLNILNNVKYDDLLKFTNEFIKIFIKSNEFINNNSELINFYRNVENKFKLSSDEYLSKCDLVIDELIKDKRPYTENKLLIIDDTEYHGIESISDYSFLENIIIDFFNFRTK